MPAPTALYHVLQLVEECQAGQDLRCLLFNVGTWVRSDVTCEGAAPLATHREEVGE